MKISIYIIQFFPENSSAANLNKALSPKILNACVKLKDPITQRNASLYKHGISLNLIAIDGLSIINANYKFLFLEQGFNQCGRFCISGQTIRALEKRIKKYSNEIENKLIINIGTSDVLKVILKSSRLVNNLISFINFR